jgi:Zn-dependent protease
VNTQKLRGPLWRAAVSAAGPAMNLLCLIVIGVIFRSTDMHGSLEPTPLAAALALLAFLQATALILNLLPVPGLDGFGILQAVLPVQARAAVNRIGSFVMIAFLIALFTMPALFTPIFGAAIWLCEQLWIGVEPIAYGLELFRFWEAPADPFSGA